MSGMERLGDGGLPITPGDVLFVRAPGLQVMGSGWTRSKIDPDVWTKTATEASVSYDERLAVLPPSDLLR